MCCCLQFTLLSMYYRRTWCAALEACSAPLMPFLCACVDVPKMSLTVTTLPGHHHCKWLQAYSRHSLSRAALVTAGAPIFLLDTFTQLILYYTPGYPPSLPFPPPHSTLLRKTIQALKQHRQVTPQLKMLRGLISSPCVFRAFKWRLWVFLWSAWSARFGSCKCNALRPSESCKQKKCATQTSAMLLLWTRA